MFSLLRSPEGTLLTAALVGGQVDAQARVGAVLLQSSLGADAAALYVDRAAADGLPAHVAVFSPGEARQLLASRERNLEARGPELTAEERQAAAEQKLSRELRASLIRLAHSDPSLRASLLPLLRG